MEDVFNRAVGELKAAGAEVLDPIVIPDLKKLLAARGSGGGEGELGGPDGATLYFSRNPNSPFKNRQDLLNSPDYDKVRRRGSGGSSSSDNSANPISERAARERLLINIMKVMADHNLDAIVHKAVEHSPTLIKDGINPPYVNHKGAPSLNTTLIFAASIVVPAGYTVEGLPVGITFFGKPYSEPSMIKFAYAYEQGTLHRSPPKTTPALSLPAQDSGGL